MKVKGHQTSACFWLDGFVVAIERSKEESDGSEQTNCLTESLGTINLGVKSLGTINLGVVPFC